MWRKLVKRAATLRLSYVLEAENLNFNHVTSFSEWDSRME